MRGHVILVDNHDNEIGTMPKLEAHRKGVLHRAFSIFIFNSKNELLLQQRAFDKYHSGGLWSNTCCSHPLPKEITLHAAKRRLREEMGINVHLKYIYSFIYKAKVDNELSEHEFDHVFLGCSDEDPTPEVTEVANWKYISLPLLLNDIKKDPKPYTVWFIICINEILERALNNFLKQ